MAVAAALAVAAPACGGDGTVELAFRPAAGDALVYETRVESTTVTDRADRPPEVRRDRTRLDVVQEIIETGDDGVLAEVSLSRPGTAVRTFVVRFDRAAQLTDVELVEGIPAAALGELGLSAIFPPGAGAPPDTPLAPGDRWEIDDEVALDGQPEPSRLTGEGRLVSLGVEDGHDTATVHTTTRLPVQSSSTSTRGGPTLAGVQVTEVTATYDLADGALRRADSVTTATYRLLLSPPAGTGGAPIEGTLRIEIRSQVRRR